MSVTVVFGPGFGGVPERSKRGFLRRMFVSYHLTQVSNWRERKRISWQSEDLKNAIARMPLAVAFGEVLKRSLRGHGEVLNCR